MKRTEFVKRSVAALGVLTMTPWEIACDAQVIGEGDAETANNGACIPTVAETAGPYPTRNPADQLVTDVTADRKGTRLLIRLTVQDYHNECAPLRDAIVDIWHCDAAGNYSEYGGTGMQPSDYTEAHFLRGRQLTDSKGEATFASIFPGWYRGRAPHIHVQVQDAAGKSLLVTQIAFPENICKLVYQQGVYAARGVQDTSNETDTVFRDGFSTEMALITGDMADGYELTHVIVVKT